MDIIHYSCIPCLWDPFSDIWQCLWHPGPSHVFRISCSVKTFNKWPKSNACAEWLRLICVSVGWVSPLSDVILIWQHYIVCIFIYTYIHIYIYIYIYTYIYLISRYKVSLMWDSNPQPSDFCFNALPIKLVSLSQGHKDDHWCTQTCDWLLTISSTTWGNFISLIYFHNQQCYLNVDICFCWSFH